MSGSGTNKSTRPYDPKGHGRDKAFETVHFAETEPPDHLRSVVHRFLELKTQGALGEDYGFHALPDACTYVVLDQSDTRIAGVTRLKASSEELNLGRSFHFVNIRFLPGVWQPAMEPVHYGLVDTPYSGALPLVSLSAAVSAKGFAESQSDLSGFVDDLVHRGTVVPNPVTEKIFDQLEDIHSVADMAEAAHLSARQLQRTLKATTGFTPHDFLKVLRLQQSLKGEPSLSYADQSHFIHSFKRATGYTPARYSKKFDV